MSTVERLILRPPLGDITTAVGIVQGVRMQVAAACAALAAALAERDARLADQEAQIKQVEARVQALVRSANLDSHTRAPPQRPSPHERWAAPTHPELAGSQR